jgi:hypothetical protein
MAPKATGSTDSSPRSAPTPLQAAVKGLEGGIVDLGVQVTEMGRIREDLQTMFPGRDSWRNPVRARAAVAAQLDYSERTLVRNTLDYLDARRDHLIETVSHVRDGKVQVNNRGGAMEVSVREFVEHIFTDIRKSVLRHNNAYFRQMRYFMEIQVTGGQIPPFPNSNDEPEA